jgi:predicted ABC-type ATPase
VADAPKELIIAGPNGAGKTTFAREFLPNEAGCPIFVNADLIAAGLAPFAPESAALLAGRLMLEQLEQHFRARQSFAFETTLAGRAYLRHIQRWRAAGYRVKLIYLRLASAEEAIARVAQRVAQGGHHIPEETIRRRFGAGLHNFQHHTQQPSMPGPCTTIQARSPLCSIGTKAHEHPPHRVRP